MSGLKFGRSKPNFRFRTEESLARLSWQNVRAIEKELPARRLVEASFPSDARSGKSSLMNLLAASRFCRWDSFAAMRNHRKHRWIAAQLGKLTMLLWLLVAAAFRNT